MKRVLLGLLLAAATALLAPGAANAAATYETFVGCDGLSKSPAPSHVCQVGDLLGIYFEANADTEYLTCIEFPAGNAPCTNEKQEAQAGALYSLLIAPDEQGDYLVTWFVEGVLVGSWAFRLDSPPPPAPIVTTPPTIAPAPSVECLKAQKRVGTLKGRLRNTKGRSQKAKVRDKLKNARATVKRAC